MISAGRLGDLYGGRRLFTIRLALFTLTSLACGLAFLSGLFVLAGRRTGSDIGVVAVLAGSSGTGLVYRSCQALDGRQMTRVLDAHGPEYVQLDLGASPPRTATIAATYPLFDVRKAYRKLEQSHTSGKTVLLP